MLVFISKVVIYRSWVKIAMKKTEIIIEFAQENDFNQWMNLVNLVKLNFPGLDSVDEYENYKKTLLKNINRKTAICARNQNEIVGILLFSKNSNCLSFMAVHPNFRRQGIGTALVERMLSEFHNNCEITVSTFRNDNPLGKAPRSLYEKFGFIEGGLITEFNYPLQKFYLKT